jgi:hypothetical protein
MEWRGNGTEWAGLTNLPQYTAAAKTNALDPTLQRIQEGRQAQRDPARPFAVRLRQAADCPGTTEAHWQPRQGGHRQELPGHACREQPIGRARGCRREVRCPNGRTPG